MDRNFPARDIFTTDQEKIRLFQNLINYKLQVKKEDNTKQYAVNVILPRVDLLFMGLTVYLMYRDEDYHNVLILSDYFVDSCRKVCKFKNYLSPQEYYSSNYSKLVKELEQRGQTVNPANLRELLFKYVKVCGSNNPGIIKFFIEQFRAKSVLDFSAGWGDRLLGAMASNIDRYTGVDPNACLHPKYLEMVKLLLPYSPNPKMVIEMVESKFEDYQPKGTYDLVYTSPPYFDYEIYTSDPSQSIQGRSDENIWYNEFLKPSVTKSLDVLRNKGYIVLYLSQEQGKRYVNHLIQWLRHRRNVFYLGCIFYSSWNKKHTHPIFIFKKSTTIPKILYNPIPFMKMVTLFGKKFNIIRDDLIVGGTKTRAMVKYLAGEKNDRIVQRDDLSGISILSTAYSLYLLKKENVELEAQLPNFQTKDTDEIKKLIIIYHPNTKFITSRPENNSFHLIDTNEILEEILVKQLQKFFHDDELKNIQRLWLADSNGFYTRVMRRVFPSTKILVVKIVPYDHNLDGIENVEYYQSNLPINKSFEPVYYDTISNTDAKVWEYIKPNGEDGDYIWNFGGTKKIIKNYFMNK